MRYVEISGDTGENKNIDLKISLKHINNFKKKEAGWGMGKGDGKGERERGKRKKEGLCGELLKAELSLIFYLRSSTL